MAFTVFKSNEKMANYLIMGGLQIPKIKGLLHIVLRIFAVFLGL